MKNERVKHRQWRRSSCGSSVLYYGRGGSDERGVGEYGNNPCSFPRTLLEATKERLVASRRQRRLLKTTYYKSPGFDLQRGKVRRNLQHFDLSKPIINHSIVYVTALANRIERCRYGLLEACK